MLPVPSGVHVWLAPGHTDMRKGFPGLSLLVQETLAKDPHAGHLFVFRGRRGDLVKIIWPVTKGGIVHLRPAQLGYLLEGIDWRAPQKTWRPEIAG